MMVKFLEEYSPIICSIVIRWKHPEKGYKCNSDGVGKENPGHSASGFCIIGILFMLKQER